MNLDKTIADLAAIEADASLNEEMNLRARVAALDTIDFIQEIVRLRGKWDDLGTLGARAAAQWRRLEQVNERLFGMRSGLYKVIAHYEELLRRDEDAAFDDYGFSIRVNNAKIRCSEMMVDIIAQAMQIVGISAYRNDSDRSLTRHLRDAHGAALMISNDRIRQHNTTMQIAYKGL